MVVRKIIIFSLMVLFLAGCDEPIQPVSAVKIDNGVECFPEIENSEFDLSFLPENIVNKITVYLDHEYGAPRYSKNIQESEILFRGETVACRKKLKMWSYPCSESKMCCVGVQPFESSYYINLVSCDIKMV